MPFHSMNIKKKIIKILYKENIYLEKSDFKHREMMNQLI
jgi:hypothetical protein